VRRVGKKGCRQDAPKKREPRVVPANDVPRLYTCGSERGEPRIRSPAVRREHDFLARVLGGVAMRDVATPRGRY